jgi:excisionase family DNA binding protein
MADTSGTYQRVSVLDAARLLGVSPTTVRRMVRTGSLQAERVLRPQGHTFVVLVPTDSQTAATSSQQVSAEARTEVPQAEAMVSLIQTTIATVLGPLVGQIDAQRQTIERQAEQLVSQAGTIGRLEAELEAERSYHSPVASNPGPMMPAPTTNTTLSLLARLRALAPWLLAVLVIVVVVALLAWQR